MEDPIALQEKTNEKLGNVSGKAITPTPSVSFHVGKVSIRITLGYVETIIQSSLGKKETLNTNSEFLKEILGISSSFILGNELFAEHMSSSVNLSSINFKGVLAKTAVTFFLCPHFLFGLLLLRPNSLSCSFRRSY